MTFWVCITNKVTSCPYFTENSRYFLCWQFQVWVSVRPIVYGNKLGYQAGETQFFVIIVFGKLEHPGGMDAVKDGHGFKFLLSTLRFSRRPCIIFIVPSALLQVTIVRFTARSVVGTILWVGTVASAPSVIPRQESPSDLSPLRNLELLNHVLLNQTTQIRILNHYYKL